MSEWMPIMYAKQVHVIEVYNAYLGEPMGGCAFIFVNTHIMWEHVPTMV